MSNDETPPDPTEDDVAAASAFLADPMPFDADLDVKAEFFGGVRVRHDRRDLSPGPALPRRWGPADERRWRARTTGSRSVRATSVVGSGASPSTKRRPATNG